MLATPVQARPCRALPHGQGFLRTLNPGATFAEGETISVEDLGSGKRGKAVRLEVDKAADQVRAYAEDGSLLAPDRTSLNKMLTASGVQSSNDGEAEAADFSL